MGEETDYQITVINGVEIKKRKPAAHCDLIIEEYFNLRKLNNDLIKQNLNNLKKSFQGNEGDKDNMEKFKNFNNNDSNLNKDKNTIPKVLLDPFRFKTNNKNAREQAEE